MTVETSEKNPEWMRTRTPRARTPVANGNKLLLADGRSMWSKRFREICAAHCQDLGGFEHLSQAELAIIKRAATLQVELEAKEAALADGIGKIDLAEFAQVSNGMRRLLETVGIKRVPRDVTPTLRDLMQANEEKESKKRGRPGGTPL